MQSQRPQLLLLLVLLCGHHWGLLLLSRPALPRAHAQKAARLHSDAQGEVLKLLLLQLLLLLLAPGTGWPSAPLQRAVQTGELVPQWLEGSC